MLTIEQKNSLNSAILHDPRNKNVALISPIKVYNKLSEMRTKSDSEVLSYIEEVESLLEKYKNKPASNITLKDILNRLKIRL